MDVEEGHRRQHHDTPPLPQGQSIPGTSTTTREGPLLGPQGVGPSEHWERPKHWISGASLLIICHSGSCHRVTLSINTHKWEGVECRNLS